MKVNTFFVVTLITVFCALGYGEHCMRRLTSGNIRGNCSHPAYEAYTNIPYAKPPIKQLRFESPHPISQWNHILNATGAPSLCVQFYNTLPQMYGSEDCLRMHVYVPKYNRGRNKLMVILWIYTGVFQLGSPASHPEFIMFDSSILLATFGYRTGALGFLSTQTKSLPGNYGLKDQRLACQWVKSNIEAFGGDPDNIILIGAEAGGASTQLHMLTSSCDARAYVSLSGSVLNPWAFAMRPQIPAKELASKLNCSYMRHSDILKNCLKKHSIKEIWQATNQMQTFYLFNSALFRPTVEPVSVQDAFLIRHPTELIREGKYRHKPYLMGTIKGEGVFGAAALLQQVRNRTDAIEGLNKHWYDVCPLMFFLLEEKTPSEQRKICKDLKKHYMCNRPFNLNSYKLLEQMFSDVYFHKGIEKTVALHGAAGQKVYHYIADLPIRYNIGNLLSGYRLDLCFDSVLSNDALGILPHTLHLPANQLTKTQISTFRSLLGLIKSMTTDNPHYKQLRLPLNSGDNTRRSNYCLYFTFGNEWIDQCRREKIICKAIRNVRCQ